MVSSACWSWFRWNNTVWFWCDSDLILIWSDFLQGPRGDKGQRGPKGTAGFPGRQVRISAHLADSGGDVAHHGEDRGVSGLWPLTCCLRPVRSEMELFLWASGSFLGLNPSSWDWRFQLPLISSDVPVFPSISDFLQGDPGRAGAVGQNGRPGANGQKVRNEIMYALAESLQFPGFQHS